MLSSINVFRTFGFVQFRRTDWPVREKGCHGQTTNHGRVIRLLIAIWRNNLSPLTKPQACIFSQLDGFTSESTRNGRITKSLVNLLNMVNFLTTWPIRPTDRRLSAIMFESVKVSLSGRSVSFLSYLAPSPLVPARSWKIRGNLNGFGGVLAGKTFAPARQAGQGAGSVHGKTSYSN